MDEDIIKACKFNSETEEGDAVMSIPGSPDDQPDSKLRNLDDEMLDTMNEIDRKILAAAILGVDITEVYSPERVSNVARKFRLRAGSSIDLTNGWDSNIEEHRRKAWSKVKKEAPYLLVGSRLALITACYRS